MFKTKMIQKKAWLTLLVALMILFTAAMPAAALDDTGGTAGQKPLNYIGTYLTEINGSTSTTGADITTVSVPVKPLIKVYVDKNVVNDLVWENNQKCVTLQNSAGQIVPATVSRISDTVNFAERQNIFITPVNNLAPGTKYSIVISPDLLAKNEYSALGMTTGNQPVVVNFSTEGTPVTAATGITLNKASMTLTEGKTGVLSATIAPMDATDKSVTWSSSNSAAAKVSQTGTITAVAPGKAVITVKTADGSYTASCTVTVNAAQVIYYVKSGDTLIKIAQVYGITSGDLITANNLDPSRYLYVGQPVVIPTVAYTVQSGDYLYKVALKYGATTSGVIAASNLGTNYNLYVGQKLYVPVNLLVYTVKAGDTLWMIAQQNATTTSNIIRLNNLDVTKPLYIGQKLKINC